MKEYLNKFKELRKDPKKKSISLLIIYGIFFIFVIFCVRSADTFNNFTNNDDVIETQDTQITSYEYQYEINKNNDFIKLSGTYFNNQYTYTLDNDTYYIDNNTIYSTITNEPLLEYSLTLFNYENIKKYINKLQYNTKTEYQNGEIKYEYIVKNYDFASFLNEENNSNEYVFITTIENNNIYNVQIDLSNYYNIDNYKITLNYSNINNISDIKTNN